MSLLKKHFFLEFFNPLISPITLPLVSLRDTYLTLSSPLKCNFHKGKNVFKINKWIKDYSNYQYCFSIWSLYLAITILQGNVITKYESKVSNENANYKPFIYSFIHSVYIEHIYCVLDALLEAEDSVSKDIYKVLCLILSSIQRESD